MVDMEQRGHREGSNDAENHTDSHTPGLFREPPPPPQSMGQPTGPNCSLLEHGSWFFWELTAASPFGSRNVAILAVRLWGN